MIPIAKPTFGLAEWKNLSDCLTTGWISSQGKFVKEFEDKFAHWVGCRYGVATTSGTTALHLALVACRVEERDEVIVPVLTFIASANVVKYCGGRPIFVDVHPGYWNLDPAKLEEKIYTRTAAIMPVHLYGHPCDMDPIMDIAKKSNLRVIEDCAEAHGAMYKGKMVGSFGDIGCFSFFANKIMTTGEGGMCVTNDKYLYEHMVLLRDHGMSKTKKYWFDEIGFNYRMTNLQAAVGLAQLERIDANIETRKNIKQLYDTYLGTAKPSYPWAEEVCWLYTTLVNNRDKVIEALAEEGIESRPMFYPLTDMPPYFSKEEFPVAKRLSEGGITLPTYVGLTNAEIQKICKIVKEVGEI